MRRPVVLNCHFQIAQRNNNGHAVLRALAFHQCVSGLISKLGVKISLRVLRFSALHKPTVPRDRISSIFKDGAY